jgi:hypothetical protein
MANTVIEYAELRVVIEPELTQVYVRINNLSNDDFPGVQGWHHKSFPASSSILAIVTAWADGLEDPVMWPQKAP